MTGESFAPISKERYEALREIEATALAYVLAVNKEASPDGCADWTLAEELTLEALHAALGFRAGRGGEP